MDKKIFNDIVESLNEAVEISKGIKQPSRVFKYTELDVKNIRDKVNLSQSGFAQVIGVSIKTVQNWEQGRRRPTGPARTLLKVFSSKPKEIMKALHSH